MNAPRFRFLKTVLCVLASNGLITVHLHAAKSVSHYGITWTFLEDRPTGVFANGEPWVLGPLTIIKIDPVSGVDPIQGTRNGSMVNPVPDTRQGFDSEPNTGRPETLYDATKNVALNLPLGLVAGDILASSKTTKSYPDFVDTVCLLTVLASSPPEGSFRPGPFGKDRAIRWNKSDVDYSVLMNFSPVPGTPSRAAIEAKLPALPWWEWSPDWTGGLLIPWRNAAAGMGGDGKPSTYGREIAIKWGEVALWLNLNHSKADKEKATIQTIQCGIDIANYLANGGGFYPGGGHKCGRKFPLFLAAVALKDRGLLDMAKNPSLFQEDLQTFIVKDSDVGRVVTNPSGIYNASHVGLADWGVTHGFDPANDDSRWNGGVAYRFVVWPAMAGQVLAADLMNQKEAWGHPAIFAYNERFYQLSGLAGVPGAMWRTYKEKLPSPPTGLRVKKR